MLHYISSVSLDQEKKSQQVEGHNKIQKLLMTFYNLLKVEADKTETGDSSQPPEAALSTH